MNVLSPILVTELGIETEVRFEQRSKAPPPISVTELGMVAEVSTSQPIKAFSPILVTELGITKSLISSPLIYRCFALYNGFEV